MKNIEDMSIDEIQLEMKGYMQNFDPEENYVFISYAHKDCSVVYPAVLSWMREGYNIYLDLDFENHSSDNNWVEMMQNKISSNSCKLVVCFYSENYCFSYPSMIELLTTRSKETIEKRHSIKESIVSIDIIELDNKPKDDGAKFSSAEVKQCYKQYFKLLKEKIGEKIWENNKDEEKACEEGLMTLYDNNLEEVQKNIKLIKNGFATGMTNFYPEVALIISKWRKKNNLNGNTKSLAGYNVKIRFDGEEIYKKIDAVPEMKGGNPVVKEPVISTTQINTPVVNEPVAENKQELLYYGGAFGRDNGLGGLVLMNGSKISKNTVLSCPDGAKKRRKEALECGMLIDNGSSYILKNDMEFKSLSGAACFVSGTSVNGKLVWNSEVKNSNIDRVQKDDNNSSAISSRINQICLVIKEVKAQPYPITNYVKTLSAVFSSVAEELNIGKSSVVDKCQRQLNLNAMEFAKYLRDYIELGDDTLYNIVFSVAKTEAEKTYVNEVFGKN